MFEKFVYLSRFVEAVPQLTAFLCGLVKNIFEASHLNTRRRLKHFRGVEVIKNKPRRRKVCWYDDP